MPQRKSALKELRKSLRRRKRNLAVKRKVKETIKRFKRAVQQNDISLSQEALREVYKVLDKAASKRVIHPNKAARKKSRAALLLKKLIPQNINQQELNN